MVAKGERWRGVQSPWHQQPGRGGKRVTKAGCECERWGRRTAAHTQGEHKQTHNLSMQGLQHCHTAIVQHVTAFESMQGVGEVTHDLTSRCSRSGVSLCAALATAALSCSSSTGPKGAQVKQASPHKGSIELVGVCDSSHFMQVGLWKAGQRLCEGVGEQCWLGCASVVCVFVLPLLVRAQQPCQRTAEQRALWRHVSALSRQSQSHQRTDERQQLPWFRGCSFYAVRTAVDLLVVSVYDVSLSSPVVTSC